MGLLFTNVNIRQSPAYPQYVTHKHESSAETLKQVRDWQKDLQNDWIEQELETNLINVKCWSHHEFRTGKIHFIVAAEINGKPEKFEFSIRDSDFSIQKVESKIREFIAEMIVKPLTDSVLDRMVLDGHFRLDKTE